MPSIKRVNIGTSVNALDGLDFQDVPAGGAYLSLWASCVTATDVISVRIGQESILVNGSPNIEASADVVDNDRDQILFREPVPPGKLFVPITATTAVNFLLALEYA